MPRIYKVQGLNNDRYVGQLHNGVFTFQDVRLNKDEIKIIDLGQPCRCSASCTKKYGAGQIELVDGSLFGVLTWESKVGFLKKGTFSNLLFDFDLHCESLGRTFHFGRWDLISLAYVDDRGVVARIRP